MNHKLHQIKHGFPVEQSAGTRVVCVMEGSLYLGVIICLHNFFAKEVIFEH